MTCRPASLLQCLRSHVACSISQQLPPGVRLLAAGGKDAPGGGKPAALKEELVGALLLTLQQHPAAQLPASFAPLAPGQEGNMAAVLAAAANQHNHRVLAAWLGSTKIALQVGAWVLP